MRLRSNYSTLFSLGFAFLYLPLAHAGLASRIEEAALNGVAAVVEKEGVRTLYGSQINGPETGHGKYACARVVAAVANKAGESIRRKSGGLALAVWEIEAHAKNSRWTRVDTEASVLPGDMVVYRKLWNRSGDCTSGNGSCHVGIMTREGLFQNHPFTSRPDLGGGGLWLYTFKVAYRPHD